LLASRISVSNLHKNTKKSFSDTIEDLYTYIDPITGENASLIAEDVYNIVKDNAEYFDSHIIYDRDFKYDYFGFKTLERSYLLRCNGEVVERPQHMLMRVAVGIHKGDIEAATKTYNLMSEGWFTHATPTLFNSGTPKPQMSSCFLLQMKQDSIEGIYDTLKQCARISQSAGGIGLSIHDIRLRVHTSKEQTEHQTELYRCFVSSMTQLVMLTRVVENVKVRLQFIWSLGILIFSISLI